MLGILTRSKMQPASEPAPARTPDERRRILAALATEQARAAEYGSRLAARIEDARQQEAQARELLARACAGRAQLEGEQLAESASHERRIAGLRRQLIEGAPPDLDLLKWDITALIECARTKVETWLGRGWENVEGRRPETVSTNADSINAFIHAAQQLIEDLKAEALAERPALDERFGPFAELSLPAAQFERASRPSDTGTFGPRRLVVPAALAAQFAAISGVSTPTPLLSPAEVRSAAWEAERSAQRRWSGEAWR